MCIYLKNVHDSVYDLWSFHKDKVVESKITPPRNVSLSANLYPTIRFYFKEFCALNQTAENHQPIKKMMENKQHKNFTNLLNKVLEQMEVLIQRKFPSMNTSNECLLKSSGSNKLYLKTEAMTREYMRDFKNVCPECLNTTTRSTASVSQIRTSTQSLIGKFRTQGLKMKQSKNKTIRNNNRSVNESSSGGETTEKAMTSKTGTKSRKNKKQNITIEDNSDIKLKKKKGKHTQKDKIKEESVLVKKSNPNNNKNKTKEKKPATEQKMKKDQNQKSTKTVIGQNSTLSKYIVTSAKKPSSEKSPKIKVNIEISKLSQNKNVISYSKNKDTKKYPKQYRKASENYNSNKSTKRSDSHGNSKR